MQNKTDRFAFHFELVDQLHAQLKAELAQHQLNMAENQRELTIALKELAEVRYELAKRDREATFAAAPSPSTMMH